MTSGVSVDEASVAVFNEMKTKRNYKWYTFKISDDRQKIVPGECGVPPSDKGKHADKAAWDDLGKELLDDRARYAVFDTNFIFKGKPKDKIVFVSWTPEGASSKDKMIYASSKDYLKKALQFEKELQATDVEERSYEAMIALASKNLKD